MRNPKTGKTAQRIRFWFTTEGESPQKPYGVKRIWQDRWVAVPDELMEPAEERWSISTEHGETLEP